MIKKLTSFFLNSFIFIFLFLFTGYLFSTQAYFKQEQFYDWGGYKATYSNVLGATETTALDELPDAGILPDNPFYFSKKFSEQFQLFFTFNEKTKAKQRLTFANRRLAEAQALIQAGKVEDGLKLINTFEDEMKQASNSFSKLEKKEKNITDLAKLFEKTTAVHTSVLEKMAPAFTDQNQTVIEKALSATQLGMDRAAQALGEPAVPIDLLARLNSLRGQGLITQEEATSLVQTKDREEARQVFKNFVDQGLIPAADFKRFDSGQAKYFANDFSQSVEMYKFKELVNFEKQPIDETTKKKIGEFAKTYQPGNIIPPEFRDSWARTVRFEEVQKTIDPSKINTQLIQGNNQLYDKFQEIRDRARPTVDEARLAEEYIKNNPNKEIPPNMARIISLKDKFGVVKPGERPPPGHQEATFLPQEIFQFKEIPYQVVSQKEGSPGGFDYQTYLKEASFLPLAEKEPPKNIKCPEGSTWNGWICFFPPSNNNQSQDFRQPFNPPSLPPTNPGQPQPSYQPYREERPGVYVPPPVQNQNQGQYPSGQQAPFPSGVPSSNQFQQPPNIPSCPPGAYWNGSTCHFPPSNNTQPPPNVSPPPNQNNPPPNNQPPPENNQPPPINNPPPPENQPPPQNNPPPNNPPPP